VLRIKLKVIFNLRWRGCHFINKKLKACWRKNSAVLTCAVKCWVFTAVGL